MEQLSGDTRHDHTGGCFAAFIPAQTIFGLAVYRCWLGTAVVEYAVPESLYQRTPRNSAEGLSALKVIISGLCLQMKFLVKLELF